MADTRLILAVSIDDLPEQILETGFHKLTDANTLAILEDCDTWFGPRDTLENFDAYRQVIPYVIVAVGDKIVSYVRQGGESRLHGKISFGAGGHIDIADAQTDEEGRFSIEDTLQAATLRELDEELHLDVLADEIGYQQVGLLVENATEVDRVHIGVVSVARLSEAPAGSDETGEIQMLTIAELQAAENRLENWSKILLPLLPALVS